MEFWIGLSVGMHLGRVLAGYLERFGMAYGLLGEEICQEVNEIEEAAREIGQLVEEIAEE
jgi:hypothetical protein